MPNVSIGDYARIKGTMILCKRVGNSTIGGDSKYRVMYFNPHTFEEKEIFLDSSDLVWRADKEDETFDMTFEQMKIMCKAVAVAQLIADDFKATIEVGLEVNLQDILGDPT